MDPAGHEVGGTLNFLHESQADVLECRTAFGRSRQCLFADATYVADLNAKLDELSAGREFLSLDVFDTLLHRGNESELSRFVAFGRAFSKHLNASVSAEKPFDELDGFFARLMGTKVTYARRPRIQGCREGSLTEIHSIAAAMLLGAPGKDVAEAFREIELSLEAEYLSISEFWLQRIKSHIEAGGKCILISDMYMHAADIRDLLVKLSFPMELLSGIFSSADLVVSKRSGKVFEEVSNLLSASPTDFLHVGDSFRGDYAEPRKAGWEALHLPVPQAELRLRAQDHNATAQWLVDTCEYRVEIQCPYKEFLQ